MSIYTEALRFFLERHERYWPEKSIPDHEIVKKSRKFAKLYKQERSE